MKKRAQLIFLVFKDEKGGNGAEKHKAEFCPVSKIQTLLNTVLSGLKTKNLCFPKVWLKTKNEKHCSQIQSEAEKPFRTKSDFFLLFKRKIKGLCFQTESNLSEKKYKKLNAENRNGNQPELIKLVP